MSENEAPHDGPLTVYLSAIIKDTFKKPACFLHLLPIIPKADICCLKEIVIQQRTKFKR